MSSRVKPGGWRAWAAWGAAAAVLALGACIPLAGVGFVFDLGANFAAQGLAVGGVVIVWLGVRREWGGIALALTGSLAMAWSLAGRPLSVSGQTGARPPVRVLVFNSSTTEGDAGEAMALIERAGADVVVLTEPSGELLDLIRASDAIAARYPGYFLPERAAGGYILVLSVWAQVPVLGEAKKDVARAGLRVMRIERPEGAFALMALHPDSPRSPGEWAKGNQTLEQAVGMLHGAMAGAGLPVVVAADLNSTPSGWRSRRLTGAGLRRAKPLLAGGTYPAGWPWPLSIAIDDVWFGPGIEANGWRRLDGGGSDHSAVLVDLSIPVEDGARGR